MLLRLKDIAMAVPGGDGALRAVEQSRATVQGAREGWDVWFERHVREGVVQQMRVFNETEFPALSQSHKSRPVQKSGPVIMGGDERTRSEISSGVYEASSLGLLLERKGLAHASCHRHVVTTTAPRRRSHDCLRESTCEGTTHSLIRYH